LGLVADGGCGEKGGNLGAVVGEDIGNAVAGHILASDRIEEMVDRNLVVINHMAVH